MGNEIELVSDGDGLAVIGEPKAFERFLRSNGLWEVSNNFDLRRLKSLVDIGSDVAQVTSELSANWGRWIKLTEESARLVKEHGLMESKTPGVSHLMVGVPGKVKNWLQTEQGLGSLLSNPATLSGVAGLMAQAAGRQTMAEIVAYLERINTKVDDVLGKVDDTVLKDMRGARFQIRRALTIATKRGESPPIRGLRYRTLSGKLADVEGYALLQLEAIAKKQRHGSQPPCEAGHSGVDGQEHRRPPAQAGVGMPCLVPRPVLRGMGSPPCRRRRSAPSGEGG